MSDTPEVQPLDTTQAEVDQRIAAMRTPVETTRCPRCGGLNGNHGLVHTRHAAGGGGSNTPCPADPTRTTEGA